MKRILKLIVKTVPMIALIVLFSNASGLISRAIENNHKDEDYVFYFFGNDTAKYATDKGREKKDRSSSYMHCTSACEPHVDSSRLKYNALVHGCKHEEGKYMDCHDPNNYNNHSTVYTFYAGDTKFMSNYVREARRYWAKIRVRKNGMPATFRGEWSPDSI